MRHGSVQKLADFRLKGNSHQDHAHFYLTPAVSPGVLKTVLRFESSLEGPIELTEGCALIVMVHCSNRIWIKISQRKKHMGQNSEKHQPQSSQFSSRVMLVSLPTSVSDIMLGVLSAREAPLSLVSRIFIKTQLCESGWPSNG